MEALENVEAPKPIDNSLKEPVFIQEKWIILSQVVYVRT